MQSIQTEGITDAVADTLFIPLYMRARETRMENGIINDPDACRIVDSVDYDFSKYDSACRSQIGTCIRVRFFDNVTRNFIGKHDNPVIINIGCGLDSRASRVGGDKGLFYNLDLPEVMEVRDKLLPADERNISLHESLFDTGWPKKIKSENPDAQFLILAEGVLLYFTEDEVRPALQQIVRELSPGEILFDASTTMGCKMSSKHDTVKYSNAKFLLELDDDRLPEKWAPNLRLKETRYFMNEEPHRWDFTSRLMSKVPFIFKAFRMLRYEIQPISAQSNGE